MALFCFWTRRACSRFAVLGQPIPSGTSLEKHMARCPACRAYWNDLSLLTSDLDRFVTVPRPAPWLAEPVWERVRPSPRSYPWERVSWAAAAACGLVCGWAVWRAALHSPASSPAPLVARGTPKMPDEPPMEALPAAPGTLRLPSAGQMAHDSSIRRTPDQPFITWRGRPHRNTMVRARLHPTAPPIVSATEPVSWQASGQAFEAQGDPGLANVAYQAAYLNQPSEETAFDMGRSAEESGDMEQALSVYANLLDAADVKSRIEKGPNP